MAEEITYTPSYDYSSVGSFGSSGLEGETINKLRAAEEKDVIDPIITSLNEWHEEADVIVAVEEKVGSLLETIKAFDLFSVDNNAFEQITANSTGTSAIFDAVDLGSLETGSYQVNITQLAQQDVWQSNTYTEADLSTEMGVGTLDINGESYSTDGKTLSELVTAINNISVTISASLEQVGDDSYRLVVKSEEPGVGNALTITETGTSFGFNDIGNHTLSAQNLQASVNGIDYDVSSTSITVAGNLEITASEIGQSTLNIQQDDSSILPAVEEIVTAYNELADLINDEIYNADTPIEDTSTLKSMLSDIKNMFLASYGPNDENAINLGFSFDINGTLSLDSTTFSEALSDDPDNIENFFLGVAEDEGFGTQLKEKLDDLNSYNGLFVSYIENMQERQDKLEEDKEQALETLDAKYDLMSAQFASYGAIINQLQSSFSGLEQMIAAETSS